MKEEKEKTNASSADIVCCRIASLFLLSVQLYGRSLLNRSEKLFILDI